MKIVIFGANVFLGRVLTSYFLRKGDEVTAIARREEGCIEGAIFQKWVGVTLGDWVESLDYSDAIINLAGRTVNCRYSEKNKAEILESRTHTTMLIGEAIQQLESPPKVWVNSSTATIYQHTENTDDNSPNTEADGVIGTFIMRSEVELVLKSRWAYPKVLEDAGFTFKMPELERALLELKVRI